MTDSLRSEFESPLEAYLATLSRGLPMPLRGWIRDEHTHEVIVCRWDIAQPRPPHVLTPVVFNVALTNTRGREQGYNCGIEKIWLHPALKKLGIAKTLVRNAIDLFRLRGDKMIDVNTEHAGALFWQNLGFKPDEYGREIDGGMDEDRDFAGRRQQLWRIEEKLKWLKNTDVITAADFDRLVAVLNKEDGKDIWEFLDLDERISYEHLSESYEGPLQHSVMQGLEVALELDTGSNAQMERFLSKTDIPPVDTKAFGHAIGAYVAAERFRYEQDRIADEIYGHVYR